MASSMQDEEEVHHCKQDDDTKHVEDYKIVEPDEVKDDDDKKIVASESATSEQEVKDANQEGGMMMMMVPSTTSPTRSLTQEEEEELREMEARGAAILLSMFYDVPPKNPSVLEIDDHEEDDSEQTMRFLTRWKAPKIPPRKIIHRSSIERCSRPIQKQLTTSDVNSSELVLPRKRFQQLLDETESARGRKETYKVLVYGPDGKVHEMWLGDDEERSSFELTLGWRKFVVDYELKECCDFVTVWMFRHRDAQKICLAVDAIRLSFRKEVSKRISEAAFEDSD
ncbi:hypothetical protein Bca101_041489 [Brassica carinata]